MRAGVLFQMHSIWILCVSWCVFMLRMCRRNCAQFRSLPSHLWLTIGGFLYQDYTIAVLCAIFVVFCLFVKNKLPEFRVWWFLMRSRVGVCVCVCNRLCSRSISLFAASDWCSCHQIPITFDTNSLCNKRTTIVSVTALGAN